MKNTLVQDIDAVRSNLLFPVVTAPVRCRVGEMEVTDPNHKMVLADRGGELSPVSVMGSDFAAFDYADVFGPSHDALMTAGAEFKQAGLLGNGGRFFASYLLPGDISPNGGNDETRSEITIRTALDGSWKTSACFGVFRLICSNGMFSLSVSSMLLGFKRSKNGESRLPEIVPAIDRAIQGGTRYKEDMGRLADTPLNGQEMERFALGFFAKDDGTVSTRARNEAEAIVSASRDRGQAVGGATAYDLLQGATFHYSHERGNSAKGSAEWHDSNAFGAGARHKARFAETLLNEGKRTATLAKGEKVLALAN